MLLMSNVPKLIGLLVVIFSLQLVSLPFVLSAMKLQTMTTPKYLIVGHSAQLSCNLSGIDIKQLHSVNWYGPGKRNFYRFNPRKDVSAKMFPMRGFKVNMERSSALVMVLTGITREAAGVYTCEVTSAAPSFYTLTESKKLSVIDLPDSPPVIRGYSPSYTPGDQLVAVCVSKRSHPQVDLQWFLNQDPAELWHHASVKSSVKQEENNLTTTYSKLVYRTASKPEQIAIKCLALMPRFGYTEETEVSVSVRQKEVVGARVSSFSGSSLRHSTNWIMVLFLLPTIAHLT